MTHGRHRCLQLYRSRLGLQAKASADAIFVGRVVQPGGSVRFSVERTVVGSVSTEVVVHNGPGTCGFSFNLGERYLVYARRDASTGEWSTSICTRTQPLEVLVRGSTWRISIVRLRGADGLGESFRKCAPQRESLRPVGLLRVSVCPCSRRRQRSSSKRPHVWTAAMS